MQKSTTIPPTPTPNKTLQPTSIYIGGLFKLNQVKHILAHPATHLSMRVVHTASSHTCRPQAIVRETVKARQVKPCKGLRLKNVN